MTHKTIFPRVCWEVPQKPVTVRIPLGLIDRLEHEAVESFRSLTSKGSEIGGLLIGDITPGSPLVVSIADYDLIECDYTRGPLYRLSDADLGRFEQAIQQLPASGGSIAGFFRSHTRKGISLDADDLALLEAHFRDPHHIALLVRPFATKASTAGIFIWENGRSTAMRATASSPSAPLRRPQGYRRLARNQDRACRPCRATGSPGGQARRPRPDRPHRLAPRNLAPSPH